MTKQYKCHDTNIIECMTSSVHNSEYANKDFSKKEIEQLISIYANLGHGLNNIIKWRNLCQLIFSSIFKFKRTTTAKEYLTKTDVLNIPTSVSFDHTSEHLKISMRNLSSSLCSVSISKRNNLQILLSACMCD